MATPLLTKCGMSAARSSHTIAKCNVSIPKSLAGVESVGPAVAESVGGGSASVVAKIGGHRHLTIESVGAGSAHDRFERSAH